MFHFWRENTETVMVNLDVRNVYKNKVNSNNHSEVHY